jgi:hypothetical protein
VGHKIPSPILKVSIKTKLQNENKVFYLASGRSSRTFPDLPSLVKKTIFLEFCNSTSEMSVYNPGYTLDV